MKTSKAMTAVTAFLLAALLFAVSVAVPILCRPFYYAHIDSLSLPLRTGLTKEEIKCAYDEMLSYCLGKTEVFSTGTLAWSEQGKSHFDDVAKLFRLDFIIIGVCVLSFALILFIKHKRGLRFHTLLGRGPLFWSAVCVFVPFAAIGGFALYDFEKAFDLFHRIFFPGKTNWVFDTELDQIIRILPSEFFMNCAILIISVLFLLCSILIFADILLFRKKKVLF